MSGRKIYVTLILLGLLGVLALGSPAVADGPLEVIRAFEATESQLPEGIAVDKSGNIFVGLGPPLGEFGEIWKIEPDGTSTVYAEFPGGPAPAGLAIDAPGNLYFAYWTFDAATRGVYRIPRDGVPVRLPGTEQVVLPNGLALDKKGNVYVSDSILGAVWRIPRGGEAELWFQHEWLQGCGLSPGLPPVGANGVAIRQRSLYVASTEQGLLVRVPINVDGGPGDPQLVAGTVDCDPGLDELDSLDGIALDVHGDIVGALVIQSKLVKVDAATGEVSQVLDGSGLHNPASLAFGTGQGDRQSVFITNFALLPGPGDSLGPAVLKLDVGVPGQPLP